MKPIDHRRFYECKSAKEGVPDNLLDRLIKVTGELTPDAREAFREMIFRRFKSWAFDYDSQLDSRSSRDSHPNRAKDFKSVESAAKKLLKALGARADDGVKGVTPKILDGLLSAERIQYMDLEEPAIKNKLIVAGDPPPTTRLHFTLNEIVWLRDLAAMACSREKLHGVTPKDKTHKGKDPAQKKLICDLAYGYRQIYGQKQNDQKSSPFVEFAVKCIEECYGEIKSEKELSRVKTRIYRAAAPHIQFSDKEKI